MVLYIGSDMKFLQQLIFFCLWFVTGVLSLSYIYTSIFKISNNNPVYMKQVFGLVSLIVLYVLYKAYQVGVVQNDFLGGIKWVIFSWLPYFIVLIGYLILAKVQGRL
jgi:membrane protein CcdC involved in cytochrome C biogenesis